MFCFQNLTIFLSLSSYSRARRQQDTTNSSASSFDYCSTNHHYSHEYQYQYDQQQERDTVEGNKQINNQTMGSGAYSSVTGAGPGLLRRRYSVPEIIMRK